jgi:hypothetical protein
MRCCVGKWLVVLLLILATGGHWAILQSLAWIGMAVTYSQSDSLPMALKKTFGGEHPCDLCKFVAEGKKSEKREVLSKLETKLDFLCPGSWVALLAPELAPLRPMEPPRPASRNEAPPGPPPRLA